MMSVKDRDVKLKKNESIQDDVIDILKLGFPIFLSSLSWVGVSPSISRIDVCS